MAKMGRKTTIKPIIGAIVLFSEFLLVASPVASQSIPEAISELGMRAELFSNEGVSLEMTMEDVDIFLVDFQILTSRNVAALGDIELQIRTLREDALREIQGLEGITAGQGPQFRAFLNEINNLEGQRLRISAVTDRLLHVKNQTELKRREMSFLLRAQQFDQARAAIEQTLVGLEEVSDSLQTISVGELNRLRIEIPSILDCPGPGCPLAF